MLLSIPKKDEASKYYLKTVIELLVYSQSMKEAFEKIKKITEEDKIVQLELLQELQQLIKEGEFNDTFLINPSKNIENLLWLFRDIANNLKREERKQWASLIDDIMIENSQNLQNPTIKCATSKQKQNTKDYLELLFLDLKLLYLISENTEEQTFLNALPSLLMSHETLDSIDNLFNEIPNLKKDKIAKTRLQIIYWHNLLITWGIRNRQEMQREQKRNQKSLYFSARNYYGLKRKLEKDNH